MRRYFENHGYVAECVRKLHTDFGRTEIPSAPYVRYPVKKVRETVHTSEDIAAVAESAYEAPSISIYRRSQELNILETSLRRILHKDIGMTPYSLIGSEIEAN